MKNMKKLIAIVTMVTLLILAAMTCALADEKIYTSPAFKLPKDKIQQWVETIPDEETPEEGAEAEGEPAEGEEVPAAEGTVPEDGEKPEASEQTEDGEKPEGTEQAEAGEQAEGTEQTEGGEQAEGTEQTEGGSEEPAGEPAEEPAEPERKVSIYSSQGDVVTEGEIIYLTSVLEGFDGLDISFQWEVDRDDGNGWVPVEGANRSKHMFVASKETIKYSWRLVVSVNE